MVAVTFTAAYKMVAFPAKGKYLRIMQPPY